MSKDQTFNRLLKIVYVDGMGATTELQEASIGEKVAELLCIKSG